MTVRINELPQRLRQGIDAWITIGRKPGGFLTAVLCGDRAEAEGRADDINAPQLDTIFAWVETFLPAPSHGSQEKVEAWAEHMGFYGMNRP